MYGSRESAGKGRGELMNEDDRDFLIVIPRRLIEAILLRDDERREIPATASEAREQRIVNRRLEKFWIDGM
jgi:hypothetical protein